MDTSETFERLANAFPGLIWACDDQGYVQFNNQQWTEFTGLSQQQGLGYGWLDAIYPPDAAAFRARLPLNLSLVESAQAQMRIRRHDGVFLQHLLTVRCVEQDRWVGFAIEADDLLNTQLREQLHGSILELVIASASTDDILAELCRAAERQIVGATCSVLLIDQTEQIPIQAVGPGLPNPFIESIQHRSMSSTFCTYGHAVQEKRDIFTSENERDRRWADWHKFLGSFGYRASWSKPVFNSEGNVIATLDFYFRELREPSPSEQSVLGRLRSFASVAIERLSMLDALRESEEHYRHTVEQNPLIPWTSNPAGEIMSVSSRWLELTGLAQDEALGNRWVNRLHPDDVAAAMASWTSSLATGTSLDISYRMLMKTGEYRWNRARANPRYSSAGTLVRWYGTNEDIHEQYLANAKLRYQAFHDELTGLHNRRSFLDTLSETIRSTHDAFGLIILDMDDFKQINDRYGHLTGDAVLKLFAKYLSETIADSEFVARLGGDEFAVICRGIANERRVLERAQHIASTMEDHLKKNAKSRFCRLSTGCAIGNRNEPADDVFKRADLALYAAKEAGKSNTVLFDPSMRSASAKRSEELDLARAALREGWIEPFYQPIVRLQDGRARGYEALLRIRHPEHGVLLPQTVARALNDPRLADSIAVRMAQAVVADVTHCAKFNVRCGQISINLATENLVADRFIPTLLELLRAAQLPRSTIKLEITESVLMDELGSNVIKNLTLLRENGVGIALDDFGTGYASLIHLQTLPVDEIKIDRSFVSGLGSASNRGEIVRAMLGLAQNLGLTTVAEGVENSRELDQLSSWGCDYGQGFFFGHPLPLTAHLPGLKPTAPSDGRSNVMLGLQRKLTR